MSDYTIPEWAKQYRVKNTEIKMIGGKPYLYEVKCQYSREEKKKHNITKYLGKLVEGKGLVKKNSTSTDIQVTSNVEYGLTATLSSLMSVEMEKLKKHFPNYWRTILGMAYCRLMYTSPIKDMQQHIARSYLSVALESPHMSADYISKMIKEIGGERQCIASYFREFAQNEDYVIFDGTDFISKSGMRLPRLSKTKKGSFDTTINVMLVFSVDSNVPMYYRLARGNVKDIKVFLLCLEELNIKDVIIIVDKGFVSDEILSKLDNMGQMYIAPLHRDNKIIDYSLTESEGLKSGGVAFQYHGRTIFAYRKKIDDEHAVDLFLDHTMRTKERSDLENRIYENLQKATTNQDQKLTWDSYNERLPKMGTIAIYTNINRLEDKLRRKAKASNQDVENIEQLATPEYVYKTYKFRNSVEEQIDIFKNVVDADSSYMHDEECLDGWMFTNYVALQWYFRILNKLGTTKHDSTLSTTSCIDFMKDIRKVRIGNTWKSDPLSNKEEAMAKALGIIDEPSELVFPKISGN